MAVIPGTDTAPVMIAAKDGLFRDHGLDVAVKTYNSLQSEVQALKNGSVDIAAGDYADFFYEDAAGKASLHLVADGYDATSNVMEVLSLPGSGITTPQKLAHKVVATPKAAADPVRQQRPLQHGDAGNAVCPEQRRRPAYQRDVEAHADAGHDPRATQRAGKRDRRHRAHHH